jgi:hypothetical protein
MNAPYYDLNFPTSSTKESCENCNITETKTLHNHRYTHFSSMKPNNFCACYLQPVNDEPKVDVFIHGFVLFARIFEYRR